MDLFANNQKVVLSFLKNNTLIEMTCTIDKVFDDRIHLVLPQYFMRYIDSLLVGCKVMAKVFLKSGTVDFNAIVINSPLEEYFAIELDYNSVKLTPSEEMSSIGAIENITIKTDFGTYNLKTISISAMNFKFVSESEFCLGDIIECSLILPKEYGTIDFKARIEARDEVYDTEYTARYTVISDDCMQSLLYYIYMYANDLD